MGYGYGSRIRAGENGVRLRGQAGEISMYRCGYWESGCGTVRDVEAFMTGKEKGVEREISIKQIR